MCVCVCVVRESNVYILTLKESSTCNKNIRKTRKKTVIHFYRLLKDRQVAIISFGIIVV